MIAAGYMAKTVERRDAKALDWLQQSQVEDIYSVAGCISENFADFIHHWKHNGFWLVDSPATIREIADAESVDLNGTTLFYYEVHPLEFTETGWLPWSPEPSLPTRIVIPETKRLQGFDVVTFLARSSPECSPLSCSRLAKELPVNEHCLFETFEEAEAALNRGAFQHSEPGPYRIFAVYTVPWPSRDEPMIR